jgi:hypothetical protein
MLNGAHKNLKTKNKAVNREEHKKEGIKPS